MLTDRMKSDSSAGPGDSAGDRKWLFGVSAAHFAMALLLFAPFFLFGVCFSGGADSAASLLFARGAARAWDLGLWNPGPFCGVDFTAEGGGCVFSPLLWPLFFLPGGLFFPALTLLLFFECWLLGVFGWLFFRCELGCRRWAFFASCAWQCGAFAFWGGGGFPDLTAVFFMTAALWLVWTARRRGAALSWFFLFLCFALMFLSSNPRVSFPAAVFVCAAFVYREWPSSLNPFSGRTLVFVWALLTGLAAAGVKILPFAAAELARSPAPGSFYAFSANHSNVIYLALASFVPWIFGASPAEAVPLIERIVLVKKGLWDSGMGYYGAAAALLALFSPAVFKRGKFLFWFLMLFFAGLWVFRIQPVCDIMSALSAPLHDAGMAAVFAPLPFIMTAALTGLYLETRGARITDRQLYLVKGMFLFIAGALILAWAYISGAFIPFAKAAFILAAVFAGLAFFMRGWPARWRAAFGWLVFLGFAGLTAALVILNFGAAAGMLSAGMKNPVFIRVFFSLVFEAGLLLFLWAALHFGRRGDTAPLWAFWAGGAALLVFLIWPFPAVPAGAVSGGPAPVLAFAGALCFGIFALTVIYLISRLGGGRLSGSVFFVMIFALSFADIMIFVRAGGCSPGGLFRRGELPVPDKKSALTARADDASGAPGNLLRNSSFSAWSGGEGSPPDRWSAGAPSPVIKRLPPAVDGGAPPVSLRSGGGEFSNIHQTVVCGRDLNGLTFSFGVWVRTVSGEKAFLHVTDERGAALSPKASGGPGWEWLEAAHTVKNKSDFVRAHIIIPPGAEFLISRPAFIEGSGFLPGRRPPPPDTPSAVTEEPVDTKNYRLAGGSGFRTCGGAGQFSTPFYVSLRDALPDRGRYFELTGCRYFPSGPGGALTAGGGALPRLAFFTAWEAAPDDGRALARLGEPLFQPLKTLLIERPAGFNPRAGDAVKLDYNEINTGLLSLRTDFKEPGLVFFGDSFSPFWRAFVNGKETPVIRADHSFMAFEAPAGANDITLRFEPKPFFRGAAVSAAGLFAALLTALFAALSKVVRRFGAKTGGSL
jgi:hypothetical protein